MNTYAIWVDLAPGAHDLEFAEAVKGYLGVFLREGWAEGYRLKRRKFGFGPTGMGEWSIEIDFVDLAQMDRAFEQAARRTGDLENLHHEVYSRVVNFRSGLYRDFPDPVRGLE
ncbi:MAG TPA: hypothetical protein PLO61_09550 [Fimbriimonadaceae bacterium]|nr:hypothetical protein [Fimbriimonadaceae bacterium]HRJ32930.1 hypothetical protein [Fimbriimonadaceae bacterium]